MSTTTETVSIAVQVTPEQAARIREATVALENAHMAVGDAAGNWVDDENAETKAELREAVKAWRGAGETFHRVMTGR